MARQRIQAARGLASVLLLSVYQRRDRVALVLFGGDGARLAVPPTRGVSAIDAALAGCPTGGATPLAAGLELAGRLALREQACGQTVPLLLLLSDGDANVPLEEPLRPVAATLDALAAHGVLCALAAPVREERQHAARELAALMPFRFHAPR